MSKTRILLVLGGFVLIAGVGCSVEGTWVLCPDEPAVAQHDYVFSKVRFNEDTSFQVVTRIDGRRVKAAGTYDYCSCKERLTLRTGDKELVYKVRVPGDDRIVFMRERDDGTVLTMTMLRQHACPDCATCGPCNMMYRKYRPRPGEDFTDSNRTHR